MPRAHISLKVKLAAALLQLRDDAGALLIPYEDGKLMTADQVISLFHFDHYPIRHEDGGPDEPWNLPPRLIAAHRHKTATIDKPQSAKGKRIREVEAEHRSRMDLIDRVLERSRPKSRLRSRGFDKRFSRTMSGKVVPRRVNNKIAGST